MNPMIDLGLWTIVLVGSVWAWRLWPGASAALDELDRLELEYIKRKNKGGE